MVAGPKTWVEAHLSELSAAEGPCSARDRGQSTRRIEGWCLLRAQSASYASSVSARLLRIVDATPNWVEHALELLRRHDLCASQPDLRVFRYALSSTDVSL